MSDWVELELAPRDAAHADADLCVEQIDDECVAVLRDVTTAAPRALTSAERRALESRAVGRPYDARLLSRVVAPMPINRATPWIDGSHIYGRTNDEAERLRTFVGGQLTLDRTRWPRRNSFVQLAVIVEMFVRDHNRRCVAMQYEQPNATDDEIYLEIRYLVSSEMQHITLDEWFPQVTGEPLPDSDRVSGEQSLAGLSDVATADADESGDVLGIDFFERDERADVSATFALACMPALVLSGSCDSFRSGVVVDADVAVRSRSVSRHAQCPPRVVGERASLFLTLTVI